MDFDWLKLEREDAERLDRSAFAVWIGYLAMTVVLTVVLLATGRFGDRWLDAFLPGLLLGGPALFVWFRRRRRNEK